MDSENSPVLKKLVEPNLIHTQLEKLVAENFVGILALPRGVPVYDIDKLQ